MFLSDISVITHSVATYCSQGQVDLDPGNSEQKEGIHLGWETTLNLWVPCTHIHIHTKGKFFNLACFLELGGNWTT